MRFLLLTVAAMLFLGGTVFAGTSPCENGATAYFACSQKSPGYECGPDGLRLNVARCCTQVPGHVISGTGDDATCVAAKCGNLNNGDCDTNNKPKVCLNGALVDNATKCGCPTGTRISANGHSCDPIPCNDSGVMVNNGMCSGKTPGKKCVGGTLVDKASECPCSGGKTKVGERCVLLCEDGTEDGACSATKPKKCTNGYLLDAADSCGCPDGKNAVGKQCADSVLGSLGSANVLGGGAPTANDTGTATGASSLSCCCLPTALIALAAGFVFVRKR